jgi:hypothetical protein
MASPPPKWESLDQLSNIFRWTSGEKRGLLNETETGATKRGNLITKFLQTYYPALLQRRIVPNTFLGTKSTISIAKTEQTIAAFITHQASKATAGAGLLETSGFYKKLRQVYNDWLKNEYPRSQGLSGEDVNKKRQEEAEEQRRQRESEQAAEIMRREAGRAKPTIEKWPGNKWGDFEGSEGNDNPRVDDRRDVLTNFLKKNGVDLNYVIDPVSDAVPISDLIARSNLAPKSAEFQTIRDWYTLVFYPQRLADSLRTKAVWDYDTSIQSLNGATDRETSINIIEEFLNNNDPDMLGPQFHLPDHRKRLRRELRESAVPVVPGEPVLYSAIKSTYERRWQLDNKRPDNAGGPLEPWDETAPDESQGAGMGAWARQKMVNVGSAVVGGVAAGLNGALDLLGLAGKPQESEEIFQGVRENVQQRIINDQLQVRGEELEDALQQANLQRENEREEAAAQQRVLEQRNQEVMGELQSSFSERDLMQRRLGRDAEEINQLSEQLRQQRNAVQYLSSKNEGSLYDLNLLKEQLRDTNNALQQRNQQLAAKTRLAEELAKENQTKISEIALLKQNVARLSAEKQGKPVLESEYQALNNENKELLQQNQGLRAQVNTLTAEKNELGSELEDRVDQVRRLEDQNSKLGQRNLELTGDQAALRDSANKSEINQQDALSWRNKYETLLREQDAWATKEKTLSDNLAIDQSTIARKDEAIEVQRQSIITQTKEITGLKEQNRLNKEQIQQLQGQLQLLENRGHPSRPLTEEERAELLKDAELARQFTRNFDRVKVMAESAEYREAFHQVQAGVKAHTFQFDPQSYKLEHIEKTDAQSYYVAFSDEDFATLRHHWPFYLQLTLNGEPFYQVVERSNDVPLEGETENQEHLSNERVPQFYYRIYSKKDEDRVVALRKENEELRLDCGSGGGSAGKISPKSIVRVSGQARPLNVADYVGFERYEAERLALSAGPSGEYKEEVGRAELTLRLVADMGTQKHALSFVASQLPLHYYSSGTAYVVLDMRDDIEKLRYRETTGLGHTVFPSRATLTLEVVPRGDREETFKYSTKITVPRPLTLAEEYAYGTESVVDEAGMKLYASYLTPTLSSLKRLEITLGPSPVVTATTIIDVDEENTVRVFLYDGVDGTVNNSAQYASYVEAIGTRQPPILLALYPKPQRNPIQPSNGATTYILHSTALDPGQQSLQNSEALNALDKQMRDIVAARSPDATDKTPRGLLAPSDRLPLETRVLTKKYLDEKMSIEWTMVGEERQQQQAGGESEPVREEERQEVHVYLTKASQNTSTMEITGSTQYRAYVDQLVGKEAAIALVLREGENNPVAMAGPPTYIYNLDELALQNPDQNNPQNSRVVGSLRENIKPLLEKATASLLIPGWLHVDDSAVEIVEGSRVLGFLNDKFKNMKWLRFSPSSRQQQQQPVINADLTTLTNVSIYVATAASVHFGKEVFEQASYRAYLNQLGAQLLDPIVVVAMAGDNPPYSIALDRPPVHVLSYDMNSNVNSNDQNNTLVAQLTKRLSDSLGLEENPRDVALTLYMSEDLRTPLLATLKNNITEFFQQKLAPQFPNVVSLSAHHDTESTSLSSSTSTTTTLQSERVPLSAPDTSSIYEILETKSGFGTGEVDDDGFLDWV